MTTILLCISDPHAGHKLGLMAPGVMLQAEGPNGELTTYYPQLGAVQEWLWFDIYARGLDLVGRLANGAPIVTLLMGDLVHGDAHPEQIIGTRKADQILIACANLRAALDLPNVRAARFVFGTGAHEFGEGSAALIIQAALQTAYKSIDMQALYHGLATIDGVTVDYAHHGPGVGQRSWLHGNGVRYYLRDVMFTDILAGNAPPRLLLRGHVHEPCREVLTVAGHTSEACILPSLCGLGDYARKVTKSQSRLACGIVAYVLDNGKVVDYLEVIERVDVRTREEI